MGIYLIVHGDIALSQCDWYLFFFSVMCKILKSHYLWFPRLDLAVIHLVSELLVPLEKKSNW